MWEDTQGQDENFSVSNKTAYAPSNFLLFCHVSDGSTVALTVARIKLIISVVRLPLNHTINTELGQFES